MYIPTLNAKISRKFHRQGSGSEMTLQVESGSGSEINSSGSATLIFCTECICEQHYQEVFQNVTSIVRISRKVSMSLETKTHYKIGVKGSYRMVNENKRRLIIVKKWYVI